MFRTTLKTIIMEIIDFKDVEEKVPLYLYLGNQTWRRAIGLKERKQAYEEYVNGNK